jgi:hypothetical protein
MIENLDNSTDDSLTLKDKFVEDTFIAADDIELSSEQIALATKLSASAKSEDRWQSYLDQLAMIGVKEWLHDRAPELKIKQDYQKPIGQLTVGDFNISVITLDSIKENFATISKAAITQPTLQPHLYVLVEVLVEPRLARICGCISQLKLVQQQEIELSIIEDENDATYLVPLDWFELDPAQVLLYLRCIQPSALIPQVSLSKLPSIPQFVVSGISQITEKVEQVVQELSWILLPPLSLSSAVRSQLSKVQMFEVAAVEKEIQCQEISVPSNAIRMYQDFQWKEIEFRLYAIKWELATNQSEQEWSLLLILGTLPKIDLPPKIIMRITNETQDFNEVIVSEKSEDSYFYTQIIGVQQEKFQVTIQLPDETCQQFEPISFTS